ncbi:conserved protein of unknown function [Tenacibaculum sp. 190524A02b]|uniref:hypothetical protein n=1 Tax=Tenacibaculum vairaonense TaxID=3137860 RepID=UPI0032B1A0E6
MNKTYNILWIDDEHNHEEMDTFIIQTEQQDILLHGYGSFVEGFEALEADLNFYDAIVLDALFFEEKDSETVSPMALGSAIKRIYELRTKKTFPYFILSGQSNFTEVSNPIIEAFKLRCYNKKNSEDVKELLINIKKEADAQVDLQIKHENQQLFDILKNYPDSARDTFISIFKGLKGINNQFDDQLYFTQLRIILETMFRMANAYGLLHDKCVQVNGNKVNLSESSLFLSGYDTKHLKVSCSVTHFPKIIADNVKNIIDITGAASHTTVVDVTKNIHIQAYRNAIKTPYLLYSLALQLMDTLIWFDDYIKVNSDIATNKSHWQDIMYNANGNKYEIGKLQNIARNGWGTILINGGLESISVFKDDITRLSLKVGDQIKFTIKASSIAKDITKA